MLIKLPNLKLEQKKVVKNLQIFYDIVKLFCFFKGCVVCYKEKNFEVVEIQIKEKIPKIDLLKN